MGEPVRFDVELRRGAGAYICGEETALFNSIEGFRGEPRNKPPFPAESGLFGKPTVVNNVETLVNVLDIVRDGGAAFAATGTEQSTGTKLFCVSGCAVRPGVYEVPFGTTLKALIDRAGGVRDGRSLQAVLLGGAAGVFVTPDGLDLPLTLEGARTAGATLGSGVVMLFDDRADLRDITVRIAEFFRDESCGQCVPCRVGTVRQEEALHPLSASPRRHARGTSPSSTTSRRSCATRRSAASARPRLPPCSRRSKAPGVWMIQLTIDGRTTTRRQGTTILQACNAQGIDTPTLCYLETLTPVNACRVCVVELEGARTLAPACSRTVEPGMVVHTHTERVRHSRKLVLEMLGVVGRPVARVPDLQAPHARIRRGAASALAGATVAPAGEDRQRSLYVRDYRVRALLQVRRGVRHRRAEHVRHRRRRTRIRRAHLDRVRIVPLPGLGVRLLRQLHRASARPAH